jgi:L,D-peptidoglycan transpeptidase YkuD (ErfK/YbiS/YcfS/YnhG family)
MRKAGIVLVTVLALTATGALVAPAQAVKRPATPGRIDGLAKATRAIVVYSWSSPVGIFGFVYGFGSRPDPGMRGFAYRRLRPNSCWSGSRADYNRWVTRPCTYGESLWKNRRVAYQHAAGIDFNYRRPVYKQGSGIFLHQQTGGPTAGCVSLNPGDLVAVLRWLRPGTRIAMGPSRWLMR